MVFGITYNDIVRKCEISGMTLSFNKMYGKEYERKIGRLYFKDLLKRR
ncbi:MAG: hypothetical protein QXQ24_02030 [Nitrososphaeria archaeon]